MFMVASIFAIAHSLGRQWYVVPEKDHTLIQGRTFHNYIDNLFYRVPLATPERIAMIKAAVEKQHYPFSYLVDIPNVHTYFPINPTQRKYVHIVMDSMLQSFYYFHHERNNLLDLFSLPPSEQEKLEALVELYIGQHELTPEHSQKQIPTLAIHVRRGDYLNYQEVYRVLNNDYYQAAYKHLESLPQLKVLIFSDDIAWCKKHLALPANYCNVEFISEDIPDYLALMLMTRCQHVIGSNSTFSWWGAYLNQENGIKIFPATWRNDGISAEYYCAPFFTLITDEEIAQT